VVAVKKHLKRKPIDFMAGMWAYEESGGLEIYSDSGLVVKIPLATIRAYLRRLDKGKKVKP
jgi:hypothetical protein